MDEARVARLLGGLFICLRYGLTDEGRQAVNETLRGFANSEILRPEDKEFFRLIYENVTGDVDAMRRSLVAEECRGAFRVIDGGSAA